MCKLPVTITSMPFSRSPNSLVRLIARSIVDVLVTIASGSSSVHALEYEAHSSWVDAFGASRESVHVNSDICGGESIATYCSCCHLSLDMK